MTRSVLFLPFIFGALFSGCLSEGETPQARIFLFEADILQSAPTNQLPAATEVRFVGDSHRIEVMDGSFRDTWILEWLGNQTMHIHLDQMTLEPLAVQEPGSSTIRLVRFDMSSVEAFGWLIPWKAIALGDGGDFTFLGHEGRLDLDGRSLTFTMELESEDLDAGRWVLEMRVPEGSPVADSVVSTIIDRSERFSRTTWTARVTSDSSFIDPPRTAADLVALSAPIDERDQWDRLPPTGGAAELPFDPVAAIEWAEEDSPVVRGFVERQPDYWLQRGVYTERGPGLEADGGLVREWFLQLSADKEGIRFVVQWYAPWATSELPAAVHQTSGIEVFTTTAIAEDLASPDMITIGAALKLCRETSPYIDFVYDQQGPFTNPLKVGGIVQWPESAYVCPLTWRMDAVTGQFLALDIS